MPEIFRFNSLNQEDKLRLAFNAFKLQKQAEKYLKGTILAILFKKPTYLKKPMGFFIWKTFYPRVF